MTEPETTVKTTVREGRNGGKLKSGNPGHKGGGGRPPSVIREACAKSFDKRIKVLEQVADGGVVHSQQMPDGSKFEVREKSEIGDRLKALDLLGKYGGLQKIETENYNTTMDDLMREVEKYEADGGNGG